jgi:glycyl-tRNA synthetase beta chain
MRHEPDFLALASSFKRIANILARAGFIEGEPDATSMSEAAEIALWERSCVIEPRVAEARASKEYDRALRALASLRSAVDTFFDQVLVMAEDPAVRANRLSLLKKLAGMFLGIADISQIVIEQAD